MIISNNLILDNIMDLKRLKRFDKGKHEQLEQLIAWSQMMGLSGEDLVSLGGHIARSEAREKAVSNRKAVDSLGCEPIGKDQYMGDRWKLKSGGVTWWFELDYQRVKITNTKTKTSRLFAVYHGDYEVGKMHWRKRLYYATMLDVMHGRIQLDF